MEKKEKKIKKEIMPEEMLKEYMISKNVDKAVNKRAAWNKERIEYSGKYSIICSSGVKRQYGKTINELLLGITKPNMPEEMLKEYMISKNIDKAVNKRAAWNKVRKKYDGEYVIPLYQSIKKVYGKTVNELLGITKPNMPEEMLKEYMISKNVDKAENKIDTWNKARKEYSGKYNIPFSNSVKRQYGKTVNELLDIIKPNMPEEMLKEYMISKNVDKAENKKYAWNKAREEYSGKYSIPFSSGVKRLYGKTVYEFFNKLGHSLKTRSINFLTLHIDDLAFMDKTQLIHIALLDNLPKDDYKKIIDCPKGEARKEVIKSIVDGLKNSKEDEENETFEEFLEEETEKQNTNAKEETELEKNLHTGIDITEKPGLFNQKKSIEDVFMEIESLDNLGGYIEQEAIDYINCSEIQKLWNAAIYNPEEAMKLVEKYASTKGSSKFFNAIICEFLKQYKEVCDMKLPEGYSFPYQPLLMQKLTAYMVKERSQFANWSETGTGKTLSGVLASRCIDSRVTLVIAVNSTVNNWTENAIRVAYPDSKVYQKKDISDSIILDRNFHNYVVVNYEEFQNSNKFLNKWKPFVENNTVDFVILDEIQKVKSKGNDSVSKRRVVIENLLQTIDIKHGRDLEKEGRVVPVLALSATPVINTLNEGLSILSLLKGTDFISIKGTTTRRSALNCHFEIVKTGIRLVEESPARERLITFPIKRSNKDILEINKTNENLLVNIAVSNCLLKLGECIRNGYLQTGTPTLIYTELVTDVIDNAMLYLQGYGFKVGEFTGRNEKTREKVLEDFIAGKYDVLLASKPITTGVDGLQNVCNRIIPIDLPWTYAEYHQLTGRCNRKGTKFDEVTIIIPTVEYINDSGEIWSLDNSKLARIKYKQTLADVIMTGEIPDDIITKEEAFRLAKERLLEFINSDKKDQEVIKEIPVQATEIKEVEELKTRIRGDRDQRDYFSEFQGLNQRISTSTREGVFSKIITNESDWREYHKLWDQSTMGIYDRPINTVARDFLRSTKHKVLGDMGCGMNKLKTLLPDNYEVISVDMYAADETVKVCNIMDTSSIISDNSLDIAVYCLSLWSRNWRDILKDAYRILDYDGKLIIVEPVSSLSKSINRMRETLIENKFNNISVVKDGEEKFYYMTATK